MILYFINILKQIIATVNSRTVFPEIPTFTSLSTGAGKKNKEILAKTLIDPLIFCFDDYNKNIHYFLRAVRICVLSKTEMRQITEKSLNILQPIDLVSIDNLGSILWSTIPTKDSNFNKWLENKLLTTGGHVNLPLNEFLISDWSSTRDIPRHFKVILSQSSKITNKERWGIIYQFVKESTLSKHYEIQTDKQKLSDYKKSGLEKFKQDFVYKLCFPFSAIYLNVIALFKWYVNTYVTPITIKSGDLVFFEFNVIPWDKKKVNDETYVHKYQIRCSDLYEFKEANDTHKMALFSTNDYEKELVRTAIKKMHKGKQSRSEMETMAMTKKNNETEDEKERELEKELEKENENELEKENVNESEDMNEEESEDEKEKENENKNENENKEPAFFTWTICFAISTISLVIMICFGLLIYKYYKNKRPREKRK